VAEFLARQCHADAQAKAVGYYLHPDMIRRYEAAVGKVG
jgi:hypothetical protein